MLKLSLLLAGFAMMVSSTCIVKQPSQCYQDQNSPRVLSGFIDLGEPNTPMTREYCAQICSQHNFSLAGVEYAHQCFCGDEVTAHAKPASETDCRMACSANLSEHCGGKNVVDVFQFECTGRPIPPLPPPPPPSPPVPTMPKPPTDQNLCPDFTREYCNPVVSLEDRINIVLGFMTQQDKMTAMSERAVQGTYRDGSPLISRSYSWWNEALHGLRSGCGEKCPTQFPEANAIGQSFNATLWRSMGEAISTEARAFYRVMPLNGLSFFAPQLNMASNPLWGRNMECPGEDPYLTSVYAYEYVTAMQGNDSSGILKTICTPKHFTGQMFEGDGSNPWDNGTTVNRQSNDTRYPLHDLEKYYLPAFRSAMVDAGAGSVMCAYQGINGVPSCANGFLLERVVRGQWDWKGFVVSDCDAIKTMMVSGENGGNSQFGHAYSLNGKMAVQDGVYAGCDSNCGDPYHQFGMDAISSGLVTDVMLNASVRRLLRPLFQLGLFDPVENQTYTHYNWTHVNTPEHKKLALDGARQSMVLLQNPKELLPFKPGLKLLIAGPQSNATHVLLGNYEGTACPDVDDSNLPWHERCMPPLSESISHFNGGNIHVLEGVGACDDGIQNQTQVDEIVSIAADVDAIVLALGGACHEGEGTDRDYLELPHGQGGLLEALLSAGFADKIAVVIINGGPYAIEEVKNSTVSAIQCGFPGQAGGQAIAETLFGMNNPGGKLTTTIYPRTYVHGEPLGGAMPWMDSQVRPHSGFPGLSGPTEGRTYMWYTGDPVYPFGYGLSYTTFTLTFGEVPKPAVISLDQGASGLENIKYIVTVTNTGHRYGKETVMLYWKPPSSVDPLLKQQLFAFDVIALDAGAAKNLTFSLPAPMKLSSVADNGDRFLEQGTYTVLFSRGHGDVLKTSVTLTGATLSLQKFPSRWVEGHEITVDACVEGRTDVIQHTESFLTDYKRFVVHETGANGAFRIMHNASGMCLSWNDAELITLHTCNESDSRQSWLNTTNGILTPGGCKSECCLFSTAKTVLDLRSNLTLAASTSKCTTLGASWGFDSTSGFIESRVQRMANASTLCLAARSVGVYNSWS